MAGNVAEWVQDVYRPIIDKKQMILIISETSIPKIKLVPMVKLKLLLQPI
jgi:formylglycine-generating enzyme required for sulfatase activity